VVFADYQLLAAMGTLLEYLKAPPPVDAAPLDSIPFAVFPYTLPTLRVFLPQTGSEPLRVSDAVPVGAGAVRVSALASADPQAQQVQVQEEGFKDRWPHSTSSASMLGVSEWFAQKQAPIADQPVVLHADGQQPMSYAGGGPGKPYWLLTAFPRDQK
jgi:adhesin transport system outer membrane protein